MRVLVEGLTAVGFLSALAVEGAYEEHRVEVLPGWDDELPSKHYSGYLDIQGGRKHVHYYFVEKHGGGDGEPVVLWTNGGPGCSSLDGFFYEHGPFRINPKDPSKLVPFNFTWARLANMLYFEAPVGVGFSYSEDPADYQTNDDKTAQDNLEAVEKFFELFPEYKGSDFFLTGESYSGVYTPTLAEAIMKADIAGTYDGAPLRGIAVGNGCTGNELGACSNEGQKEKYLSQFLLSTALVSDKSKEDVPRFCGDFSGQIPTPSGRCKEALVKMHQEVGNVNLYNVYGECHNGSQLALKAPVPGVIVKSEAAEQAAAMLRSSLMVGENLVNQQPIEGPVACIDSRYASAYLAQEEVVKALHVKPPPFRWEVCANSLNYTSNRKNLPRDTYPALVEYLDRTIIYNGDWDACVPYTDNMHWTREMKFQVEDEWHPWTYKAVDGEGQQVGGYAVNYKTPKRGKDFIFTTIRGGRHEVPETAPEQAFELIRRLLSGDDF